MTTQQVTFQECNTQFAQIFERVLKSHEIISVYKEPEQGIVIPILRTKLVRNRTVRTKLVEIRV